MPKAAVAILASLVVASAAASLQLPLYRDASQPIAARVDDLLGRMTIEEKFWQLFMIPGSLDDPSHDYSKGVFGLQINVGGVDDAVSGSEAARRHAERINAIQRYFVERTRLGIPIIPFEEAVHGLAREGATVFPQAIALAATWDPALMTRVSEAIAAETRSRGVVHDGDARIAEAVRLARASDVAIIVAGVEEGKFRDRAHLGLPGRQEALIQAVASTGRPVVVVLIGGAAVTMSRWLDRVGAVVHAWYPGERGGEAIADVLLGDYNPVGRVPITFPVSEGQLPLHYNHKPSGRGDDYVDSTGHPLFPFGFGLSDTTFAYLDLSIEPAEIAADGRAVVSRTVKNTGSRAGDEVVQLYVRDVLASVARPVLQLGGFERVRLNPGESRVVRFELGPEHLRMLDRDMRWVVEPGRFRVTIGASSKDRRLRGELVAR